MQTTRKRIETVSETLTLLSLRRSTGGTRAFWCKQCDAEVLWVTARTIELFGIFDLQRPDAVHTNGDEVCARSLIEQIRKGEIQ